MKRILFRILVLFVLYVALGCPDVIDAVHLRFFASPENVLHKFYTERDLVEDQLMDSLILAGSKMVPTLEREIPKKDMHKRRYAIGALGNMGNRASIPVLEDILQNKNECEYFRVDALEAIANIDLPYAQSIAPQYQKDTSAVAQCANAVLTASNRFYLRSYEDALFHRHDYYG